MSEIKFYQDAEKTIQVYPEINPNGNYPGVTVGLANNLVSPDGTDVDDSFIIRTTGGTANTADGYATIKKLTGNAVSTTVEENATARINNNNYNTTGITSVTVNDVAAVATMLSNPSTAGDYTFTYTPIVSVTSVSSRFNY